MTSTTTPVDDRTTKRLYAVEAMFVEAERSALARAHRDLLAARNKAMPFTGRRKGLTEAAELVAALLRDVEQA